MATEAPQAPFRSWSFEKAQHRQYDSPGSDLSSSTFLDASSDRLRITPTMEEIRAALKEHSQPKFEEAYQSSEEALSPMLDEEDSIESSQNEADDEMDTGEEYEGNDIWEELGPFKIDMAIAICVIAVGRPKVVNLPPRWVNFRKHEEYAIHHDYVPTRSDSLPPIIPIRNRARTPVPRLDTRFSITSMPTPSTATSHLSTSPESMYSNAMNREASVYSMSKQPVPASLTPPMSEHGSDSPSFLQSDPFENAQPYKRTHSRLRSFSSKFKPLKQQSPEEPSPKALKRERRVSLIRRPATPPTSFFDTRSSDESSRDLHSARPTSSSTIQPAFIAPLQTLPEQRKMVARAANEREPAIRLPPCPPNYDQELHSLHRSQIFGLSSRSHSSPTVLKRRSTFGLGA